jgi:hypothetical protein
LLIPDVVDDDREAEDEDPHEQEEPVGDQVGDLDLVRHRVGFAAVKGPPIHSRSYPPLLLDIPSNTLAIDDRRRGFLGSQRASGTGEIDRQPRHRGMNE